MGKSRFLIKIMYVLEGNSMFNKVFSILAVVGLLIALYPVSTVSADNSNTRITSGKYECIAFTCPSYDVSTGKQNGWVFSGTKLHLKRFFMANVKSVWGKWSRVTLAQSYLGSVGGDCFKFSYSLWEKVG